VFTKQAHRQDAQALICLRLPDRTAGLLTLTSPTNPSFDRMNGVVVWTPDRLGFEVRLGHCGPEAPSYMAGARNDADLRCFVSAQPDGQSCRVGVYDPVFGVVARWCARRREGRRVPPAPPAVDAWISRA